MKSQIFATAVVLAAAVAAGCDQGQENPPHVRVAAVHAAPSFGAIQFRREEREEATLEFRRGSTFSFDADQYDFNLDVALPGATTRTRIASFSETLDAGSEYWFVLAESAGEIEPVTVRKAEFSPDGDEAEVVLVHAHESLGAVDAFLEPPGTDLASATPIGTVEFLDQLAPATHAAADYRLTLTSPGEPATVLFQSAAMTLDTGEPNLFVLTDPAEGLADVNVARLGNTSTVLTNAHANAAAGLRILNATADGLTRDFYFDGDFSAPAVASSAFAAPAGHVSLQRGEHDIAVTPEGNPGAVELEDSKNLLSGRMHTYLLTGDGNELSGAFAAETSRRIAGGARLHVINGATQLSLLGVFLEEPGTDVLSSGTVDIEIDSPGLSLTQLFAPGDYELTLVDSETFAIVSGPTPITLSDGGLYGVFIVNGADGVSADLVMLDDFN